MKGKAIYQPAGKAAEYSEWACNFFVGCSGECSYCYLKKGRGAKILGGNTPTLKKCFKNEDHALEVFEKELKVNISELQKHGLFFSFTTDPMLPETKSLSNRAILTAMYRNIPVKVLTKRADWADGYLELDRNNFLYKKLLSFGFTLTGHDENEPGTSTNAERIEAMKKLHKAGFKTFASIEPIIDFESSFKMVNETHHFCNLYKIGIESGKKYDVIELRTFIAFCITHAFNNNAKIYFKDSLLKAAEMNRSELPENCVSSDFKLHEL